MENNFASAKLVEMFQRPLIIGASVSADYLSISPAKKLAQQFTQAHHIKTIAQDGAPGRDIINRLTSYDWHERSIVVGLDLFFWDSVRGPLQASLNALEKLVRMIQELKIPLMLGEIPDLLPSLQPFGKALNNEIRRLAHQSSNIFLIPLDRVVKQILEDGFIHYNNQTYSFLELVPDGLHIGDVAGNYLADTLREILSASDLVGNTSCNLESP